MPNTLAKTIAYIKSPQELAAVLIKASYTGDLVRPSIFTGTNTVKYQHIEFQDKTLGDFNKETGYGNKGYDMTWKDLVLTQDKGDSLKIDRIDDEEAMSNGIVTIVNKYIREVQAPALDKYRFTGMFAKAGIKTVNLTVTQDTILEAIIDAYTHFQENGISTIGSILYITPGSNGLISKKNIADGHISYGAWGGNIQTNVRLFDDSKIIVVPSSTLGTGVQFALVNPLAAPAFVKYQETEYFDKIAGFGGRKAQADIGVYHDAFVYDEAVNGIYVQKLTV
jgi:hypothetical protein